MKRVFGYVRAYASVNPTAFWPAVIVVTAVVAAVLVNVFYPDTSRDVVPRPQVTTVTVFVPAGPMVCPEEDSCHVDWDGDRWVVVPEVSR